jgi:hypothetical protein
VPDFTIGASDAANPAVQTESAARVMAKQWNELFNFIVCVFE